MSDDWVTLPGLFDDASMDELCHDLDAAEVAHEGASMARKSDPSGPRAWRVRVAATQVGDAARVLGRFYDLEDPETAQPFRGDCPACGDPVEGAWTCPHCELSFATNVKPDDPLVLFLREHGGFVDPGERTAGAEEP